MKHTYSKLILSIHSFAYPPLSSLRRGICALLVACVAMSLSTTVLAEDENAVSTETAILNINTADAASIAAQLSGIGAVRAQAIVDYRLKYGDFLHIDELQDVPGIGEVTFERIKSKLSVTSSVVSEQHDGAETAQLASPAN